LQFVSNETYAIVNANLVLPEQVMEGGAVVVRDGRIESILTDRSALPAGLSREVDADGAYLMPGIVDLHNDSLETEINPRPGANLPLEFALSNLERRLISSGVIVEFHAIGFMNLERSNRTINQASERAAFVREVMRRGGGVVDHHVLHRLDVWNPEAMDILFDSVRASDIGYVSLNDHTPGQGQYRDVERYKTFMQAWRKDRGHSAEGDDEVEDRMAARAADTSNVPAVYVRVRAERDALPYFLATHDDDSPEKVDAQWVLGATVAEFPITVDAARRARERGMAIVVGAPNIVRGGSTSGNQDARELFELGLADVICADYHAPSLLVAAFRLASDGACDLPTAIRALTLNPSTAVGIRDSGAIRTGYVADMLLARAEPGAVPQVEAVYRGGVEVFSLRAAEPAKVLV
jgi:alpha-D-ribose 1-methylphosphonate 5-triphosphate diphosphatase